MEELRFVEGVGSSICVGVMIHEVQMSPLSIVII